MIQDLDETLKQLLIQKVPIKTTETDITFEMPDKDWETKPQKPKINLFLYDIRENHELRSNERFLTRNGVMGSETRDPVRMDLSYMITVWTKEVADEHWLLGNLLKALLRYPILPSEILQGEFDPKNNPSVPPMPPLRAWVSQPERIPNGWEFWSAFEGGLKAGLSYVVTIPVQPFTPDEVYLVTETAIKLEQKQGSG
ncbi:MAG: DUF4255 domain-containing protein [Iphinoe sp. HA4291-MV1]|jgi:hypothetical protein|nr:DUF4255 domain-containing protein [Iphinoe sp. HA4291-MV1]